MISVTMYCKYKILIEKFFVYINPTQNIKDMESYISILVFSAGTFQGLLLIYILLRRPGKLIPNIVLSIFVGILIIQVLVKFCDINFAARQFGPLYNLSYFLPYLYGPLTYLYIKKSFRPVPAFGLNELVHLTPFIASVMIVLLSGYNIVNIFGYINVHAYNIADTIAQLSILTLYVFLSKRLIQRETVSSGAETGYKKFKDWFNRLTNITWLTGITAIILLTFYFYNSELKIVGYEYSVLIFVFLPFMIYWLSYEAFMNPELFFTGVAGVLNPEAIPYPVKYQNNRLSDLELRSISEKLDSVMTIEKLYLFPELSLESLSKQINIPRHSISQAVNLSRKMNFNDYINSHRIEHAKRELLNPSRQHLTIAAIAFGSGFNSISTFNDAFRKFTSTTPSLFKKTQTR